MPTNLWGFSSFYNLLKMATKQIMDVNISLYKFEQGAFEKGKKQIRLFGN